MFDVMQFRDVVSEVLHEFDLYSEKAVELVLGTAAVESRFGTFLRQMGGGPALGVCQMEEATFDWLKEKYQDKYVVLKRAKFKDLKTDLRLAILMCRLRYLVVDDPLPPKQPEDMARYWKKHYNTYAGDGTIAKFVESYHKYVRR